MIKEGKAANSNGAVPAAQSSPPEDDDEAQADGASQDGAPGGNSACKFSFPNFSYKAEDSFVPSSISGSVSLTIVFEMDILQKLRRRRKRRKTNPSEFCC